MACGSLAREIQESQMQLLTVKPIPRWKIWLGKWFGIILINAFLLAVSSAAVYGITLMRAGKLSELQQQLLENEIFVARASALPDYPDTTAYAEELYEQRLEENANLQQMDPALVRRQIAEQVDAMQQIVRPGYVRRWVIPLLPPKPSETSPCFYG